MRGIPREALLGGALVLSALLVFVFPVLGALGAAAVGLAAHRAGFERLAAFAAGVSLLGLATTALVLL